MRFLRVRSAGFLVAAVAIAGASFLLAAPSAPSAPPRSTPAPRAAALELGPATAADLDERIAVWSAKVAADAADDISAVNLGVLYLGRARMTGDLKDYERAGAAVAAAIDANTSSMPARTLDAVVRYATHDFAGALGVANAVLDDEPGQADALAVVGDASLELGRIDAARAAYEQLGRLAPGPALDVRLARLAFLTGDRDGAVTLARNARDGAAGEGIGDPGFYEFQLGEFARLTGDATLGRRAFEAALALRPDDRAALVGVARIDAFEGGFTRAEALLRRAAEIAPEPATLALLGDVLALGGDAAGAAEQYDLVRLTGRLSELAGAVHDRELLLFELDHGGATPELLARARSAADARPDAAGLDVVAWALHRLGRNDEAWELALQALATGARDARLLAHAGTIAAARGDRTHAVELLTEALAAGPALDPLERRAGADLLERLTASPS